MSEDGEFHRLMQFLLGLRQNGVTDARVLAAMERTPRALFAPDAFVAFSFEDRALPLVEGVAMTKPSLVARMLQALDLKGGETVLEVGTGSGYSAAALSAIAKRVISLERRRSLAAIARGQIGQMRMMHVYVHGADGAHGWADDAPYDAILVNADVGTAPPALLKQLSPSGVLVAACRGRLIQWRRDVDTPRDLGPAELALLETGVME